jgi:hypothetical protein
MPLRWLDAVTDTTNWGPGRRRGRGRAGGAAGGGRRAAVGYGRAGHVDPEGGPWRFAIAHGLEPGQRVEAWAFGVRSDGSRDRQEVLLPGSPLTTSDGYLAPGVVHQAIQVNRGAPAGEEVAMLTPEGATLEQPSAAATSARLRAAGPARVRADGWAETAFAVEAVGQLGGPVPAGTVVLSTPADGAPPPPPPWPRSSRATRSPWPGRSPPGRGSGRPAAATPWLATHDAPG